MTDTLLRNKLLSALMLVVLTALPLIIYWIKMRLSYNAVSRAQKTPCKETEFSQNSTIYVIIIHTTCLLT
jgi:hypothetical protein